MSLAYSLPEFGDELRPDLLNLLVVDDERALREACKEVAESMGFTTFAAENAQAAYRAMNLHNIDVVLLDMRLPGASGLEILKEIKRRHVDVTVIMMTAFASVDTAVHAMKQGAYDYVTKPFNLEELRLLLGRASAHVKLAAENKALRENVKTPQSFSNIVGRSPEMEKMFRIITKVAHSTHPVLILGESGTGSGPNIHIADLPTQVQNAGRPAPLESAHPSGVVPIAEMEKEAIFSALKRVGGDKMKAARLLGIGKTTLYRKLK